jgi:DNA-binding NtrC family response regulator
MAVSLMPVSAPHTSILLVEPDSTWRTLLASRLPGQVDAHDRFEIARRRLAVVRYDLIVANLRLGAYNGLHLVYVARVGGAATPAIVYDAHPSAALAWEVQRAGAMYERKHRLPITLAAYVGAALPVRDRRNPVVPDRRLIPRGGRRQWDRHVLAAGASTAG